MNEPLPDPQTAEERLKQIAGDVAADLDADIILYNGGTYRAGADLLIQQTAVLRRRSNVLLLLVTEGGDADAAYMIARWLQRKYERFVMYVPGYCKSAGTLIATGAHELVMSEYGELGPLDVQMSKRDELLERRSGLDVQATLATLQSHALDTLVSTLLEIKIGSGGTVSLQMATEIATSMATGLFAPIYGRIDPINIGESSRAMNIARQYGERLLAVGKNIEMEQLDRIVSGYPSHSFVIDKDEAAALFCSVREPNEGESELADLLGDSARYPIDQDDTVPPIVAILSPEQSDIEAENFEPSPEGGNIEQSPRDSQCPPEEAGQNADQQPEENGAAEAKPQAAVGYPVPDSKADADEVESRRGRP